ncbi:MAG: c-type cytochrome biogenesis protein CcmI [Burkholderiales bacterium]
MTVFWILAALMIVAALAFVLLPLFRRNPSSGLDSNQVNIGVYRDELSELESDLESGGLSAENYREARAELERSLLDDVAQPRKAPSTSRSRLGVVLGFVLPLFAISFYLLVGSPGMLSPQAPMQANDLLQQLERHLEQNPNDPEGWSVLARAYQAMERYSDASAAFEKASTLTPDNAQLLADHADALARASGGVLAGRPSLLLTRALEIDPKNIKALALLGAAAYDAGDHKTASDYWQRLLAQLTPGSEEARIVEQRIAEARSRAAAVSSEAIRGTVKLSPHLQDSVGADDTLFVYAQSDNAKMPLAIIRARAKELPFSFVLDDSKGMAGGVKLSSADEVRVVARISKSGQARIVAGDLQGALASVKPGTSEMEVVIDQVIGAEGNQ